MMTASAGKRVMGVETAPLQGPSSTRADEELLRDLVETMAGLPQQQTPRIKEFSADSAGRARNAAAEWLHDFSTHGPLQIESIKTAAYRDKFVAVVAYWAA
jgi:hypothetical protein